MNQGVNSLINPKNQLGGYGLSTPAQRGDNLRIEQLFSQIQNTCTFTMFISKRGIHSKAQLIASMRHIGMSAYMYTAAATLQMNQKQGLIANIRYQYF